MNRSSAVSALRRAVDLSGGQKALAKLLAEATGRPIRQAHIWNWLNKPAPLPAEMAIPIEQITNGAVTRYELRPDIYPLEGKAIG